MIKIVIIIIIIIIIIITTTTTAIIPLWPSLPFIKFYQPYKDKEKQKKYLCTAFIAKWYNNNTQIKFC